MKLKRQFALFSLHLKESIDVGWLPTNIVGMLSLRLFFAAFMAFGLVLFDSQNTSIPNIQEARCDNPGVSFNLLICRVLQEQMNFLYTDHCCPHIFFGNEVSNLSEHHSLDVFLAWMFKTGHKELDQSLGINSWNRSIAPIYPLTLLVVDNGIPFLIDSIPDNGRSMLFLLQSMLCAFNWTEYGISLVALKRNSNSVKEVVLGLSCANHYSKPLSETSRKESGMFPVLYLNVNSGPIDEIFQKILFSSEVESFANKS